MISERRVSYQIPRLEFPGVRRFAFIVMGESLFQIAGKTDVEVALIVYTLNQVDVSPGHDLRETPSVAKPMDGNLRSV